MIHPEPHPLAGRTVHVQVKGAAQPFHLEDWWDRIAGGSWMQSGAIAAFAYGIRAGFERLPMDDEVVYGHVDGLGVLVHETELGEGIAQ